MSYLNYMNANCTVTGGITPAKHYRMSKLMARLRGDVDEIKQAAPAVTTIKLQPKWKTVADAVGLTAIRGLTVTL